MKKNHFRIICALACFISAIAFSYWIALIFSIVGFVFFDWFIEGVCSLLLMDMLFGMSRLQFHGFLLVDMSIAAVLFCVIEISKKGISYGTR